MGTRITVRLSDTEAGELAREAEKTGVSVSDIVRQTIVGRGAQQELENLVANEIRNQLAGLETRTADRISNIETLLMEKLGIVYEAMKLLAEGQDKIVRQSNTLALEIAKKRPAQPGQQAQQRPANR